MIGKDKILYYFLYILKIQITALLFLSAVRVLFVITNMPEDSPFVFSDMIQALILGVRFDNHGASFIAMVPVVVSAALSFFRVNGQKVLNAFKIYFSILYSVELFLSVANVRYYSVFGWHINYEALGYLKFFDTTAGMIFEDSGNYPLLIAAIMIVVLFCFVVKKITKRSIDTFDTYQTAGRHIAFKCLMIVVAAGCLFIGMRGSFQRYVIRVSFASFSNIPFYNKIGNNALFNIIETYKQSKNNVDVKLIADVDADSALSYVQNELNIIPGGGNPINRGYESDSTAITPNIVLVLMESMTLHNIENEIDGKPLTPFLRALRDSAYYFENFYSAGIHTNNGICATMYGYEPNFSKPCMNHPSDLYSGLPYVLKQHGYYTMSFITGDAHYDNMNSFLLDNNIDRIFAIQDYPKEKIANRFGVRDDYMFEFGINQLSEIKDKPFFAMFLTCSNHSPYSIPEEYASRFPIIDDQAIAYADDAVKYLFENAQKTEWGKNTVFIFVADHGKPRGENLYDMVYYYNRIPCYIYSQLFGGKMRHIDKLGGQIDIFPTLMSLLGMDYSNNTLGINLFKEERRYIHFVSDEHLGCADKEYFYCYNIISEKEFLYKIGNGDNIIDQYPDKAKEMREYAVNMMKINNTAIKERWINPQQ